MHREYFYLIYKSQESYKLSIQEIEQLTKTAIKNNALNHITGLLVRKDGGFVQYLEGQKADILMTYEKILRDKKHHSVEILDKGYIEKRKFANWSMLLKYITNKEIKAIETNKIAKTLRYKESTKEVNKILAMHLIENFQTSN